jgi:outer membrane immunogenic protein
MSRLSIAIIAAASVVAFGQIAAAADMPVKAPVAPAPVPYSWTGFYAGINGGYGWGRTSTSIAALDPASAEFITGDLTSDFAPSQFAHRINQRGGLVGGQIGYNWQFSPRWVAGVEADFQYAHVGGSDSRVLYLVPTFFGTNFPFTLNSERTLNWFGTLRGRIGYLATPDLLLYATGGLAYGRTSAGANFLLTPPAGSSNIVNRTAGGFSFDCNATGPAYALCYGGSGSHTSLGWSAGAGLEYHVWRNLTAKLEYLHVSLEGQTVTLVSPSPPSSPGVAMAYSFSRENVDIVRVGLNYKFN